ncbi:MAG: PASTA domain-containing protein, partial [Nitrospirota bacterium]|nr:PASTA domain-containing protein [Nitrospirota bacterium]
RVPDLVGKDVVSVIEIMNQQGLLLAVARREPNQTIPRDSIVSQNPLPGTGIKKGRRIHIVVSAGPSELLAPKVVGDQYRKADITLRQSGLSEPVIAKTWSDTIERDIVIAQDPPAGTPVEKGGKVGILVSLGKKVRVSVTPKLMGRKAEEAVRLVDRMGMQFKVLSAAGGAVRAAGDRVVTGQKPAAGSPLPADAVVELTVSK